jgi:hypothetical protein
MILIEVLRPDNSWLLVEIRDTRVICKDAFVERMLQGLVPPGGRPGYAPNTEQWVLSEIARGLVDFRVLKEEQSTFRVDGDGTEVP